MIKQRAERMGRRVTTEERSRKAECGMRNGKAKSREYGAESREHGA